jgi:hypothetical protein
MELVSIETNVEFQPYELTTDLYDPTADFAEQVSSIRMQLRSAVAAGDFLRAEALKKEIHDQELKKQALESYQTDLRAAINVEDFKRAHDLQESIKALNSSLKTDSASLNNVTEVVPEITVDMSEIIDKATKRALGGGLAGAMAMTLQVCTLMWMRTTMNYQYRHGTSTAQAMKILYKEGGVGRFYKGILPALAQGPLSRFGDTAANTGILTFLNANPSTREWDVGRKTAVASTAASLWRIFLMPIDTLKTSMQVGGDKGLSNVKAKLAKGGPSVLYHGSLAAASATWAGHFPWFFTYNFLDSRLPVPDEFGMKLVRSAGMGFVSSVISDCTSNSIRVVKTYRQTHETVIPYRQAINEVIAKDGVVGLMGRGLKTRILANGAQGVMFSVAWKYFDAKMNNAD